MVAVKAAEPVQEIQRILVLSIGIDLALSVLKVVVGWIANSHALIADGIHSLSDLATDVMAWFFTRIGNQAPDKEHPYGHRRYETFGTIMLGLTLILVAGMLIYDSVLRLTHLAEVVIPGWVALVAAALSIAIKEWLYQISVASGKRAGSQLMVANAWHHRSDAFSSIVVFVGIGGALLGVTWLEMIASIIVAIMIAQIGLQFSRQSFAELVDTGLPEEVLQEIEEHILAIEGVRGLHSLRTRRMGPDVMVDIHIQVDPRISVSEGHHIGEWVHRHLLQRFDEIGDVVFHIDAEDDSYNERRKDEFSIAPLRSEVRAALEHAWRDVLGPSMVRQVTLHYLDDGIQVEVFLPLRLLEREDFDAEAVNRMLREKVDQLAWVRRISVWYG